MVRARTSSLRLMARLAVMVPFAALLYSPSPGWAETAPDLGSAENFAVLAGPAVTCTGSTVNGDVGVSPGTTVTQTECTINGTVHAGNSVAVQANSDFFRAYDALAATACTTTEVADAFTDVSLERGTGVHCFTAAATFTRVQLTLTGAGPWIFKIGTGGTGALTGTGLTVVTPASADACNVYWWVAQAATMTDSTFAGKILAGAAITITRGTFTGDAFAKAAVTMTGTTITGCGGGRDVADLLIDHYQCYEAKPQARVQPRTVVLEDQFGKRTVTLKRPQLICTPVVKDADPTMPPDGKFPDDLANPIDHLVCYQIHERGRKGIDDDDNEDRHGRGHERGKDRIHVKGGKYIDDDDNEDRRHGQGNERRKDKRGGKDNDDDDIEDRHGQGGRREVVMKNQFGETPFTVKQPRLLCVPSLKTLVP